MENILKIGIVIADEDEYAPLRKRLEELSAERCNFYKREGHKFCFSDEGRTVEVRTVLCGIGMVNAAAATTFLVNEGSDIILNSGLSGGISGISKGEVMVGTEYVEHDFDLTPLGYKMCQKPLQEYVYKADNTLVDIISQIYPSMKKGVAVSGDSFISDNKKKEFLKNEFNAMSCDMESAAVAYVCSLAGIRFAAIRKISDDAGDDASSSYQDVNNLRESVLVDLLVEIAQKALYYKELWK